MLHTNTVATEVLDLIKQLQENESLRDFFLVGGTGLALQLGHRTSVDIDLFTRKDFNVEGLLQKLETEFHFQMDMIENNTIRGTIRDIKIDLLAHKYPLLNPVKTTDGIRLSSVQDIAAMKINAISIDGTRVKDFIDVYFLLDMMSVKELLDCYSKKYSMRNPMHALKSMQYFEDVDIADWPEMIKNKTLTWDRVKKKIDQSCDAFIQADQP